MPQTRLQLPWALVLSPIPSAEGPRGALATQALGTGHVDLCPGYGLGSGLSRLRAASLWRQCQNDGRTGVLTSSDPSTRHPWKSAREQASPRRVSSCVDLGPYPCQHPTVPHGSLGSWPLQWDREPRRTFSCNGVAEVSL